ncbi:hypothetical protein BpHYR1_047721 [Brachionus plicatilis]|uniref:Uncharacterized protein n=1 Tax=Brachionus plicatilis TaxID=10195 RepID=A0A3M7PQK5_BRAPC|nr:hypothetical protein BpHYR1_047721 [Brachionus plicatilis]
MIYMQFYLKFFYLCFAFSETQYEQAIKTQYEQELRRKKDLNDQKDLSQRLRKEQEDLEKNMTLKRERKFEA